MGINYNLTEFNKRNFDSNDNEDISTSDNEIPNFGSGSICKYAELPDVFDGQINDKKNFVADIEKKDEKI